MGDRKHDIERYLRGELSSEEMHALEKEALNDPFLAEALEGVEQAGPDNFLYDLHTIRRSVHDRLRSKSRKKNNVVRIWAWTGAIAATLLLIAVSGFIVLTLIREQAARQRAMQEQAEAMPPEFMKRDTLVIALPAQSPARRKTDASPAARPVPPADQTVQQSPSLIAEAADETFAGIASHEEPPITEKSGDQADDDRISEANKRNANPEIADAAQLKSEVPLAEEELASRTSKESRREGAAVQRAAQAFSSAASTLVLRGKVVDADGEALPGVNVIVKESNVGTITNAEGQYELQVPPGYGDLVFAFVGFESQQVPIDGRQEINVALDEDVTSLSEVVVIGYESTSVNTPQNTTFRSAEPIGGRTDFKKYLENVVKYPAEALTKKVEGRVTVRFTVEANGQLTNFEVIKGIGSGAEEALINAIKAGPAWKPGMQGDQPVADKVKVRYRFQLPG